MILPSALRVAATGRECQEELSRAVLDFVLDVGRLVEPTKRREHAEAPLRQDIRRNPRQLAVQLRGFQRSKGRSWWKRRRVCHAPVGMEYCAALMGPAAPHGQGEIERRHFALNPRC